MSETFGQALRRLRGNRSVRDVAQLAKCGKSYVSDLENGKRSPTAHIAAILDKALDAKGELIDLANFSGKSPLEQVAALHQGITETLAAGTMTDASVEEWEYTVTRHGRATRYRPAGEHLEELTREFSDLHRILKSRHPQPVRRRLLIAAAHLSGLMALTLLKLGDNSSQDWWRTGRAAASAAEDRDSLSWIYAHQSYELYYRGNIEGAIELARRAQTVAGAFPCVGPALAAPLEARAHALLGRRDEASAALARAQISFDRLEAQNRIDSALGYNENQLRFHSGNAWTHLGDTARASENQNRALELYPESDQTDRAFVRLDQAKCFAINGDVSVAAAHAADTIAQLPLGHRSPLIISRAEELAEDIPASLPEVRFLREILALPPGERND